MERSAKAGEGLAGQAAIDRTPILITDAPAGVPQGRIGSGRGRAGRASPCYPSCSGTRSSACSGARIADPVQRCRLAFFDQFVGTIGVAINTIMANSRTEALLGRISAAYLAAAGAIGRAAGPAGRAAQVQRRARGQGSAAGQAEQRDRDAEPPDRAGTAARSRSVPSSSRFPPGTSRISSPTCRTSCGHR